MAEWTTPPEEVIVEFRSGGGRLGGALEGADILLLTTIGARSGERRTTPLGYAREGGRLLVFASNAGSDRDPAWYRNLLARPRVEVEIGDGAGGVRVLAARAEPLVGEERESAYDRQSERVPAYGEYRTMTDRAIPVVVLDPLDLSVPDPKRNRGLARQLTTVHAALRGQIAALREGSAAGDDLAVHCLAFCDALGSHHATEEAVLPAFDAAFPHLAPVLARLRAEHREVALALAELRGLARAEQAEQEGQVGQEGQEGQPPGPGGRAAVLEERIAALAAEAERHFAYEEAHLLPALLAE